MVSTANRDPFFALFWMTRDRDVPSSRAKDAENGSHLNYSQGDVDDDLIDVNPRHLLQNKRLESLAWDSNELWDAELQELLRTSTTLKAFSLTAIDGSPKMNCILDGIVGNTGGVLECLHIRGNFYPGHITRLLMDAPTLKEMHFYHYHKLPWNVDYSPKEMERMAKGLVANTTLLKLSVRFPLGHYVCKALIPLDQCNQTQSGYNKTLRTLSLSGCKSGGCKLDCFNCHGGGFWNLHNMVLMLQSNDSLEELFLFCCSWNQEQWMLVFDSLKSNKSLRKLELHDCENIGANRTFNYLLELLHVNFTLEVKLDPSTLGAIERVLGFVQRQGVQLALEAVLKRNQKIASLASSFDNLKFAQRSLGRLYLCGAPEAGKTTLRRSMVKSQSSLGKLTPISKHLFGFEGNEERTPGIEIRTLQGQKGACIAIWDMAGQEEYRALHDSHYLFPEINDGCLFIFVFRATEMTTHRFDSQAAESRLEKELRYWLTFINSNLARPRVRIPQISVVLTHYDKVADSFRTADKVVEWARPAVQKMRDAFKGQVQIHQKVYAVDSRSPRKVGAIVNHILTNFGNLFAELPAVPDICQTLSLVLANWNREHKNEPILSSQNFLKVCQEKLQLPELNVLDVLDKRLLPEAAENSPPEAAETILPEAARTISGEAADKILKRWHAIVSYLNDVGWIVKFEKLDCIVVDVNWLGRDFLGMLYHSTNLRKHLTPSTQGIIDYHKLETFLEKYIDRRKYRGIKAGTLIQLMRELKICEDTFSSSSSQFFMPSTLEDAQGRAHEGTRRLSWTEIQDTSGKRPVYIGFRLLCEDSTRTFLSPGFFLRYQVHLFQKLSEVYPRSTFSYELAWNLIRVNHDGIEMLVESSETRRQEAYKNGAWELQEFCKSGDGCPGVALQEAILRPECVQELILCKSRINQAVPRKDLEKMVVLKLEQGMAEATENWTEKIYQHLFEGAKDSEISIGKDLVEASDLLSPTDFHTLLVTFEQSRIDTVERIHGALQDLEIGTDSSIPSRSEASTSSNVLAEISNAELCPNHNVLGPSDDDRQNIPTEMRDISCRLDQVIQTLCWIKINQDRNHEETLREMRKCCNRFMNTFQEEVLMEKIYRVSQLEHALPRLLYFTPFDATLSERLVSYIKLGSACRLHLMCEEPHKMHFVQDQEGLPLTKLLPGKRIKKLRPLVLASAKMMYILIKAGIHVAAGVGNIIPDGETTGVELKASFLTPETLISEIKTSDQCQSDLDFKEAWDCLVEEIIGPMRDKIPQIFGLYKVVYKASVSEKSRPIQVHWICRECRERALRVGRLEAGKEVKFQGVLSKTKTKPIHS